jgi:hypothetical protein
MNIKTLVAAAIAAGAVTTANVNAYALSSVVHPGGGGKTVVEAGGGGGGVGRVRIGSGGNTGAGGLPGVQGVRVMPPSPPAGGVGRVVGVKINPPVLRRPVEVDRDHDRINFGRIVQFDRFVSDYDERCHYVRKFWRIVKVCPDIY